jgi:hypothetical protein
MAKGLGAPEVEHAYTQAHALCQRVGEAPELVPVLYGLHRFYTGRLQLHTAREIDETLLRLAQRAKDPALAVIAHFALGSTSLFFGALPAARLHLEEASHATRALVFRTWTCCCACRLGSTPTPCGSGPGNYFSAPSPEWRPRRPIFSFPSLWEPPATAPIRLLSSILGRSFRPVARLKPPARP